MTATHKPNLAGLSRAKLRALFVDIGEKPFRAEQILKWIHQRGVLDIDLMTDWFGTLTPRSPHMHHSTVTDLARFLG